MRKLTWAKAAAWRIGRHHLARRAPAGSLLPVATRLCGLHAQLLSSAELSAWARTETLDRRAVHQALWEERTLVKTWAMRGTLHLLAASDLPTFRRALCTNRYFLRASVWQRGFGLTLADLDRVTEAISSALDGRLLTREELADAVAQITGSTAFRAQVGESSWGTILRPAAFMGRLCFAPSLGQRVRFTHPDSWLASSVPIPDVEAATAEVARRFLSAYGPATYGDLARWWGCGVAAARQWIESLGDEVRAVDLDGTPAWMLAEHVEEAHASAPARSVRLLPAFDPYVVAASNHAECLLPGDWRRRVYRPQGWISPVLLVDGRMEGTWSHQAKGSRVEVSIDPFVKVPAWVRRGAAEEAERLAAFLGGKLQLTTTGRPGARSGE
jgi:hypothetical protein